MLKTIISICGASGSGKSTIAKALVQKLGEDDPDEDARKIVKLFRYVLTLFEQYFLGNPSTRHLRRLAQVRSR